MLNNDAVSQFRNMHLKNRFNTGKQGRKCVFVNVKLTNQYNNRYPLARPSN